MEKAALRDKYKEMRMKLAPGELNALSEQIVENALKNFQLSEKMTSIFLPIERHKEVNTYHLLERIISFGGNVAVPKTNFETMEMKHYLYENSDQLSINEKGIPEPKKGRLVAADRFDYVFVPLLAVDKNGNRVGYGKGFYDRFLRKCSPNCQFIGLHFFELEDKIEDTLPSDVRLNALVTPSQFYRFD